MNEINTENDRKPESIGKTNCKNVRLGSIYYIDLLDRHGQFLTHLRKRVMKYSWEIS
jgi:hypothetical protein